jgi:hypothetical protein
MEDLSHIRLTCKAAVKNFGNKGLWRNLIKKIYNFRYVTEYNYEALYKGYLKNKSGDVDVIMYKLFAPENPSECINGIEHLRFLSTEMLIHPNCYDKHLHPIILMRSVTLFNLVYTTYADVSDLLILRNKLFEDLSKNLENNEVPYVSSFILMTLTCESFGRIINEDMFVRAIVIESASVPISIKMWESIVEHIQYGHNIGLVNETVICNAVIHQNVEVLETVLKSGPYNTKNMITLIGEHIDESRCVPEPYLMSIFKKCLSATDYETLYQECLEHAYDED